MAKRLSTIRADLQHAAADLERLAAALEDKGKHSEAANLRAQAGAIQQITYRL